MVNDQRFFFINIPVVLSNIYFVKLQNLVGRVIWGKRLNEVNMLKNLLQCSCSFIFGIFIL